MIPIALNLTQHMKSALDNLFLKDHSEIVCNLWEGESHRNPMYLLLVFEQSYDVVTAYIFMQSRAMILPMRLSRSRNAVASPMWIQDKVRNMTLA